MGCRVLGHLRTESSLSCDSGESTRLLAGQDPETLPSSQPRSAKTGQLAAKLVAEQRQVRTEREAVGGPEAGCPPRRLAAGRQAGTRVREGGGGPALRANTPSAPRLRLHDTQGTPDFPGDPPRQDARKRGGGGEPGRAEPGHPPCEGCFRASARQGARTSLQRLPHGGRRAIAGWAGGQRRARPREG